MKKFLVGNSVFGSVVKEVLNNIRIRDRKDIEVVDDANYTVGKKCKFPLHFILFPLVVSEKVCKPIFFLSLYLETLK